MKLLVGLGNPGERYARTRHNLGWLAVQEIIRVHGLSPGVSRFQGRFGDGQIDGARVAWLFPETFMNRAGQSVAAAVRFFKLEPGDILVFHDELELPPGRLRMKCGGGNAGHNGLKSIQQLLGSADFVRIRLGIGRPLPPVDPVGHVLTPFDADEIRLIEPILTGLPLVMPWVLRGALGEAVNRLLNPPAATAAPPLAR